MGVIIVGLGRDKLLLCVQFCHKADRWLYGDYDCWDVKAIDNCSWSYFMSYLDWDCRHNYRIMKDDGSVCYPFVQEVYYSVICWHFYCFNFFFFTELRCDSWYCHSLFSFQIYFIINQLIIQFFKWHRWVTYTNY